MKSWRIPSQRMRMMRFCDFRQADSGARKRKQQKEENNAFAGKEEKEGGEGEWDDKRPQTQLAGKRDLDFIRANREVLLSSFTNEITNKLKNDLWRQISHTISAKFGVAERSVGDCREKFSALKTAGTKARQHRQGTGGGPPKPEPEWMDQVDAILGEQTALKRHQCDDGCRDGTASSCAAKRASDSGKQTGAAKKAVEVLPDDPPEGDGVRDDSQEMWIANGTASSCAAKRASGSGKQTGTAKKAEGGLQKKKMLRSRAKKRTSTEEEEFLESEIAKNKVTVQYYEKKIAYLDMLMKIQAN